MLKTNLVRFCALLSAVGIIFPWHGKGAFALIVEIAMICLWAQMEYSGYKRKDNKK